jgi:DNA polymerase-3 subunit epsilon
MIKFDTYRFIAIDVETANRKSHSICQIGLAMVSERGVVDTASFLVDPKEPFAAFNIDLHGIGPWTVEHAPDFTTVLTELRPLLEKNILIQHSSFDKRAFAAACGVCDLPVLSSDWCDSVTIARRAWPELKGNGGHGLANLKTHLNLVFNHHDAEEDARAAAEVVLHAELHSGQDFRTLLSKKNKQTPV